MAQKPYNDSKGSTALVWWRGFAPQTGRSPVTTQQSNFNYLMFFSLQNSLWCLL